MATFPAVICQPGGEGEGRGLVEKKHFDLTCFSCEKDKEEKWRRLK